MKEEERYKFEYFKNEKARVTIDVTDMKELVIPSTHTHNGKTYKVTRFELTGNKEKLTKAIIPDTIVEITDSLFWKDGFIDCISLETIEIPNSVKVIGCSAFQGCKSLKSVTIPNSVVRIASNAFDGCDSLKSVTIPESVIEIEYNAFSCDVIVVPENDYYVSVENALLTYDMEYLLNVPKTVKNYSVPNTVKEVEGFTGCKFLESVTIPESVEYINEYAFADCKSLQSIIIPKSVVEIKYGAFKKCTSLRSITFPPDSSVDIYHHAFFECNSLKYVSLPEGVKYYDDSFPEWTKIEYRKRAEVKK